MSAIGVIGGTGVYDPSIHDYSVEKPVWEEIANGHFVYGNQRELEGYRKEYESQL
jgi:oligopeptide transport system ATP-binding protein